MAIITLIKLRSLTNQVLANRKNFSYKKAENRIARTAVLNNKLRTLKQRLQVEEILETLPLRSEIAASEGLSYVEVMELNLGAHLRLTSIAKSGKLEEEDLCGIALIVFKKLCTYGLNPYIDYFSHGPYWFFSQSTPGHYAMVIHW
jgi:hypothetical protein